MQNHWNLISKSLELDFKTFFVAWYHWGFADCISKPNLHTLAFGALRGAPTPWNILGFPYPALHLLCRVDNGDISVEHGEKMDNGTTGGHQHRRIGSGIRHLRIYFVFTLPVWHARQTWQRADFAVFCHLRLRHSGRTHFIASTGACADDIRRINHQINSIH